MVAKKRKVSQKKRGKNLNSPKKSSVSKNLDIKKTNKKLKKYNKSLKKNLNKKVKILHKHVKKVNKKIGKVKQKRQKKLDLIKKEKEELAKLFTHSKRLNVEGHLKVNHLIGDDQGSIFGSHTEEVGKNIEELQRFFKEDNSLWKKKMNYRDKSKVLEFVMTPYLKFDRAFERKIEEAVQRKREKLRNQKKEILEKVNNDIKLHPVRKE